MFYIWFHIRNLRNNGFRLLVEVLLVTKVLHDLICTVLSYFPGFLYVRSCGIYVITSMTRISKHVPPTSQDPSEGLFSPVEASDQLPASSPYSVADVVGLRMFQLHRQSSHHLRQDLEPWQVPPACDFKSRSRLMMSGGQRAALGLESIVSFL